MRPRRAPAVFVAAGLLSVLFFGGNRAAAQLSYSLDAVFCIDVTEASQTWDERGGRGAAVLFADALLPGDAHRSVLVFSFASRDLMRHDAAPLWSRPVPANRDDSLSYVLEQPASGSSVDPTKPLSRALEILEGAKGGQRAIFLVLGHRAQVGPSAKLNQRLRQLALEIIPRCRMDAARLYVVHRDSQPGMEEFWQDVAGATGGAAAFARDNAEMVTAAMDWAASLSGVFSIAPGKDKGNLPIEANRAYALAFDMSNDTPEQVQARVKQRGFDLPEGKPVIASGQFGFAQMAATVTGKQDTPIPYSRIHRLYARLAHRAGVAIQPAFVTADEPWTIRVDMGAFGAASDPKASLPENSCARFQSLNAPEAGKRPAPLTVSLESAFDRRSGALFYVARFKGPTAAGPGLLTIGPPPSDKPSEFLAAYVRVYETPLTCVVGLENGGAKRDKLLVKASLNEGAGNEARLVAAVSRNDGPLSFVDVLPVKDRYAAQLAPEYAEGDVYRVMVSALAIGRNETIAYLPGLIGEFPAKPKAPAGRGPEMAPETASEMPTEAAPSVSLPPPAVATPVAAPVAAQPTPPGPQKTPPREEARATTPEPKAAPTKPIAPRAEAVPARVNKNDWWYFIGSNVFLAALLSLLAILSRKSGLFPMALPPLRVPAPVEEAGADVSDSVTQVFPSGQTTRGKPGAVHEDALREMLSGSGGRRILTEEDLLGPASTEPEADSSKPEAVEEGKPATKAPMSSVEKAAKPSAAGANAPRSETPEGTAPGAPEPEADDSAHGAFTEADLLKSLTKEGFAPEDRRRPDHRSLQHQKEVAKPAPAETGADSQGQELPSEGEAAGGSLSEGFLSQDDLDALLKGDKKADLEKDG